MSSVTPSESVFGADEEEADRNEQLEYDLWEGQFSLGGPDEAAPVSKAIKNAKNQQRILDRVTSVDIENMLRDIDTTLSFKEDDDLAAKRQHLQRQLSSFDSGIALPANVQKRNNEYVLCWQQQQVLNEEVEEEVHSLQQQVLSLAEKQEEADDKYSKVKQDNSTLAEQIHMLEENLRELQVSSTDQLHSEQRRSKDLVARLERERQLEVENYTFRLQNLEKEHSLLQDEAAQLRAHVERLKTEKRTAEDFLIDAQASAANLAEENGGLREARKRDQDKWEGERAASKHYVEEMEAELGSLRSAAASSAASALNHHHNQIEEDVVSSMSSSSAAMQSRLAEMEEQVRQLNEANRALGKRNEDLECEVLNKRVEQGVRLTQVAAEGNVSLGDEMTDTQERALEDEAELEQIRSALKDQRDVNIQLRTYIDGILMNIIEKYPELLEVRK